MDINISQWIRLQAASHEIKDSGFFFLSKIAVALLSLWKLEIVFHCLFQPYVLANSNNY